MKNGCEFRNNCPYSSELLQCSKPNTEKNMDKAIGECAQVISKAMLNQTPRDEQLARFAQTLPLGAITPGFIRTRNIVMKDLEDQEPQDPRFVEPEKSDLDF